MVPALAFLGETMSTYYNEFEPFCCDWLENLGLMGEIENGFVDRRSIADVKSSELRGYNRCHFFAGIAGWDYALKLARWPEDHEVWTGSCPCQPFSAAGKGKAFGDDRHLWPVWFNLIRERHPETIFGEQVEAAINHGWLDLVQSDLEREGYAFAAVSLPAASVGAPHIRSRIFWVANASSDRQQREGSSGTLEEGWQPGSQQSGKLPEGSEGRGDISGVGFANSTGSQQRQQGSETTRYGNTFEPTSGLSGLADTNNERPQGRLLGRDSTGERAAGPRSLELQDGSPGPVNGFWRDADWLFCRDGKWRPVKSGTFCLAHGIPSRVGRLRAFGNAICPQLAAEFIKAFLDTEQQDA